MDELLRLRARAARAEIESGELRGAALLDRLLSVPFSDRDAWTDELLGIESPPPDSADLPRGSVPYLPCGVDEILAMVREVPLRADDELVDLGAGLGRVAILAHLLSGARARGIEIQEHLVRSARQRSVELKLVSSGGSLEDGRSHVLPCYLHGSPVSFVLGDAAAADVALDGSVFFLYAPFNGEMLVRVLRRLEDVARRRPIVVCAVGLELRGVAWLSARETPTVALTLYDSAPAVPPSAGETRQVD